MRRAALVLGPVLVLLLAGVWFFGFGGPVPNSAVQVYEAAPGGSDASLVLITGGCEGSPRVDDVTYGEQEVIVEVRATRFIGFGADCQESVQLSLDEPLAGRTLIDAETGAPVDVNDR